VSDPLVSIVVPTYNGERFVRLALRSALAQSYKNIEVVVVDDASTDRTPEILEAVAETDPRVRLVRRQANVGAYDNSRMVFREARGEYVKYLLHDDVLATDCVRTLVRGMQAHSGATMAFSRRRVVNEDGRPAEGQPAPLQDHTGLIDGRMLGNACLEHCTNLIGEVTTVLFRRDDVDFDFLWQVDGRRLEVLADLSLWLRLLGGGPAFYSPEPLSRFRVHAGQTSQDPAFIARGMREWPQLIDWATRHGYLSDVAQQRRAYACALHMAASRVAQLVTDGAHGVALEAVFLSTARLVELDARLPAAEGALPERAHGSAVRSLFGQELDVWTRTYEIALAAPELTAGEVSATVQALRDVHAANAATRLVLAVPEEHLERAVPLVEAALAEGPDLDVDLVPTDDPSGALSGEWLAVAPRGRSWHGGKATAVWSFDVEPASTCGPEVPEALPGSSVTP
jgi:glycosyltransferase involved in cell wall biosynthesis